MNAYLISINPIRQTVTNKCDQYPKVLITHYEVSIGFGKFGITFNCSDHKSTEEYIKDALMLMRQVTAP